VPRSILPQGTVDWEWRESEGYLSPGEAYRAFQDLTRKRGLFRLSCHSNSTLSVGQIESTLREWKRTGWVPSIVIIDYADILAPPQGIRETLDQIDETWKRLRRIAQDFNCLVLTATQSNAAAYTTKSPVLRRQHFSGRKTKLAHATGILGINIRDAWRQDNVCSWNWIVKREGTFTESQACMMVGCLEIANPIMKCVMGSSPSQPSGIDLGRVS